MYSVRTKAFTILELIVVMVILAILIALAVPSFTSVISTSYDYAAATELSAIARQAWYLGSSSPPAQYSVANLLNGAAQVSPSTMSTDPAGPNQLYLVSGASNAHLQVSFGLTGNVNGTSLSLSGNNVNLAMLDQAYHCVYETYTQGILSSTVIDNNPQYVASNGNTINPNGKLCQAAGASAVGGGSGSLTFNISGAPGDASVTLSITGGTLANASSYSVSCPQYSISPTPDTYGTLTAVTTGSSNTPEPASAISDPSPSSSSGTWTPSQSFTAGTQVSFVVSGLENNIAAECSIVALVSSTPVTSNVVNLIPTSVLTITSPPPSLTQPACNSAANCVPTSPVEVTSTGDPGPPVTPPTLNSNTLVGLTGLTSIASTDPQFNHYPFIANASDGSITQVSVSGNAGNTAPYNEIPSGGYGREMFPPGTFCVLDTSTNLCANPQPNGLAPQPITLLNGYFYGSVTSSGPTPLIENSFYVLDGNNNSIYRIDPNSYLVNSPQGYVSPVKTLVATLPSTPTGLAGFTCFTSSDTPLSATSITSPLCLYTSTQNGVYSIQINPNYGPATPVKIPNIPGGANSLTYVDYSNTPALAITYPSSASTYGGKIVYFQPGSGNYLNAVSAGNPSSGASLALINNGDPLFGNNGGSNGLAFVNNATNTVDVASTSSGSPVVSVLAGGGTTPPTTSGVSCASAQFGSIGALHQHGPLGTLFVTDSHPINGATSALDEIVQNAGGSCEVYLVWGTLSNVPITNYNYGTFIQTSSPTASNNMSSGGSFANIGNYSYYYSKANIPGSLVPAGDIPVYVYSAYPFAPIQEPSGNSYQLLTGALPAGEGLVGIFATQGYVIATYDNTSTNATSIMVYPASPYSSSVSPLSGLIPIMPYQASTISNIVANPLNGDIYISVEKNLTGSDTIYTISHLSTVTSAPSLNSSQSSSSIDVYNNSIAISSNGTTLYELLYNGVLQATSLPLSPSTTYTTIAQTGAAALSYSSPGIVYLNNTIFFSNSASTGATIGSVNLSTGSVNETFANSNNNGYNNLSVLGTVANSNLVMIDQYGNTYVSQGLTGTEYSFAEPASYTATSPINYSNTTFGVASSNDIGVGNAILSANSLFYPYLSVTATDPVSSHYTSYYGDTGLGIDPFGNSVVGDVVSPRNSTNIYVLDSSGYIYSINAVTGTYNSLIATVPGASSYYGESNSVTGSPEYINACVSSPGGTPTFFYQLVGSGTGIYSVPLSGGANATTPTLVDSSTTDILDNCNAGYIYVDTSSGGNANIAI
jgi:prepilin-type N-terminal cleavage/methylation domain-containing protein